MAVFAAFALVSLSCVKYGISLRYAAFCDIPLTWLACSQVLALSRRFRERPAGDCRGWSIFRARRRRA